MICDPFHLAEDDQRQVQKLARALVGGWDEFYRALKPMGGSFVLLVERNGIHVVLDATGTVPASHGEVNGLTVVGSHPRIVAEATSAPRTDWADWWIEHPAVGRGGRYFPGLTTPYLDVRIITPNQRFSLESRTMDRFYPDRRLEKIPLPEILELVAPTLSGQLVRLNSRHDLALSLSGGMDSRLTLAASRPISAQVVYFTYYSENNHILSEDIVVARDIADRFSLNHIEMSMTGQPPSKPYRDDWETTTDRVQGPAGVTHLLYQHLPRDLVHIRSNVLETMRGFYLKNPANYKNDFTASKLSRLFRNATQQEFTPHFEDFIRDTSFLPDQMYNFHYADLFYWEHRLGAWLGPMIRGNRVAMETYIIYNSRSILETMMSRPLQDRITARVVTRMIGKLWPEVLAVPVFSGSKYVDLVDNCLPLSE